MGEAGRQVARLARVVDSLCPNDTENDRRMKCCLFLFLLVSLTVTPSFAQTSPGSGTLNKDLQAELIKMGREDQKYRIKWQAEMDKMPAAERINPHNKAAALMEKQGQIDRKNLARLIEIVQRYGWPGRSLVGEKASSAAFLIIQHAELAQQEKFLPLLKASVAAGDANAIEAATLEDRVLVGQGKKQRYGTQVHFGPETGGKWVLQPIEDEEGVDQRRAAIGMEPLATYLKMFGIEYKPIKKP